MKQTEISALSVEQLRERLGEYRKLYSDMRMAHAVTPIENPLQLRIVRRTVARLLSELTKRELQ